MSEDEAIKKFNMIEKRLESHMYNKMIIKDDNKFILTDDFIKELNKNPEQVKKEFKFNDYDRNILNYIDRKVFSKDKLIEEFKLLHGEKAEEKFHIMKSRAKKLVKEGYCRINENDFF